MQAADWSFPTTIRFGAGRTGEVADACSTAGITRPLVVTDPGIVELRAFATVTAALDSAHLDHTVFSDLRPNPVGRDVETPHRAAQLGEALDEVTPQIATTPGDEAHRTDVVGIQLRRRGRFRAHERGARSA